MPYLSLFEAFVIVHLIMDWLFQSRWEAANKSKKWFPLFVHCFVYTAGFVPILWFYSINWWWLAFIFATHFILDRRTFEIWFLEKVKRIRKKDISEPLWQIMLVGVDQTFHLLVLAIVAIWG